MNVKFNNLSKQWDAIKDVALKEISELMENSSFILGSRVKEFEQNFANYIGCRYAVGVSNGTDAIKLSALALSTRFKFQKTVYYIPNNTFIATYYGVNQADPKGFIELIDCDDYFQIDVDDLESSIELYHKEFGGEVNHVIVPVHLYGFMCDMDAIKSLSNRSNVFVLEDSSQAHGASFGGQKAGSFGDVSAFSLFPGKNLGAAGDAGIITTNNEGIYRELLKLRNLGSVEKYIHDPTGFNNRLDTIQAIILDNKLPFLDEWNSKRVSVAESYLSGITNELVSLPTHRTDVSPVYHIFPILTIGDFRDKLKAHLDNLSVESLIHYPLTVSRHIKANIYSPKSIRYADRLLSLPIHPFISSEEISYVCDAVNSFRI